MKFLEILDKIYNYLSWRLFHSEDKNEKERRSAELITDMLIGKEFEGPIVGDCTGQNSLAKNKE